MVINEVELGPSDSEVEWVELYNTGEDDVEISRWGVWIVDEEAPWTGIIMIPRDTVVPPKGFYLAEGDERWMHDDGECIVVLKTEGGEKVDKTSLLADDSSSDFTWSRYPDGADTDRKSDWYFTRATPNAANEVGTVA